jgi:hypothetical protein
MPGREGVEQPDEGEQQPQVPLAATVPPVPLPERPLTEADREALAEREGVEAVLRMVRVDGPPAAPLADAATAFLLVHRVGWAVYDYGPAVVPDAPRAGWRRVWATSTPAHEAVAVSEAWAALRAARREALGVEGWPSPASPEQAAPGGGR